MRFSHWFAAARMLRHLLALAIVGAALGTATNARGASFNVTGNDTVGKTLNTGETGNVTATGDLNVGGGTTTVNVTGGTVSITNAGLIRATGSARTIDANAGGTALSIDNSGTISSVGGNETIRMAQTATLTLTNQLGAIISANAADAMRPGNNSIITNLGTISANPPDIAAPAGSDGIDLRTQRTGIVVHNSGTISGRHGIATDGANIGPSSITVDNNAGGLITALNGSGLNLDGVSTTVTGNVTNAFGATIRGGLMTASTDGDGDGIDVDGVLTLINSGDVLGLGAKGASGNPEGIAAGGGSITNHATGQIVGSSLLADAPNGDPTRSGNGILIDDSNVGNAVAATTVINSGLIRGKSGFGIRIIGTFADSIINNAGGTIRGAGATAGAAIQTGGGGDTVTNRGAIIGENGAAIALEDGDDALIVEGGAASISGNVFGGPGTNTVTLDPGAAQSFSYAGSFFNFNTVETKSGQVTFSGVTAYTGTTLISGGVLRLDGANRVSSSSPLSLAGGTLEIMNAGGPNGQTFATLNLTSDSVIDLNLVTSLTFNGLGTVTPGESLAIFDWAQFVSPNYAIRFLGDQTSNVAFLSLLDNTMVNGLDPIYNFDGTFTNVLTIPVPEPSTLALLGLGAVALYRASGRRRRASRASTN